MIFQKEQDDDEDIVPTANPIPWWSVLAIVLSVVCHLKEPYNSYLPEAIFFSSMIGATLNWMGAFTVTYKFLETMNTVKVVVEDESK
jgi:hypothetical protein